MNVMPPMCTIVVLTVKAADASETVVGPANLSTKVHGIISQKIVI